MAHLLKPQNIFIVIVRISTSVYVCELTELEVHNCTQYVLVCANTSARHRF